MALETKIEWCDATVNLWWGCAKIHTGCRNCYAETLSHRWGNDIWGVNKSRKKIKSAFSDLNKLQKKAAAKGIPITVFMGSMMDIFESSKDLVDASGVPLEGSTGEVRSELFKRISDGEYNDLIFLFLSKRPERIELSIPSGWMEKPPSNVWFGLSISDQKTTNQFLSDFISMSPANANLFLSVEPQVGPISFGKIEPYRSITNKIINWVIQGGESGHGKRPFKLEWAYALQRECKAAGIPYFFKQIDKVQQIPKEYLIREFPSQFQR